MSDELYQPTGHDPDLYPHVDTCPGKPDCNHDDGEEGDYMRQEKLIRLTAAEITGLKSELSGKVAEYIKLEDEKKAADADFNERLSDLWDEIRGLQARINEG